MSLTWVSSEREIYFYNPIPALGRSSFEMAQRRFTNGYQENSIGDVAEGY